MPAATRGGALPTKPDALDVALAAPKTPKAPPAFEALKPNSSLFPQTARVNVARPAAQLRQQKTVVPAYVPPKAPVTPPTAPRTSAQAWAASGAGKPEGALGALGGLASRVEAGAKIVAEHPGRAAAMLALPGPLALLATPGAGQAAHAADAASQKGVAAVARAEAPPNLAGEASTNSGILNAYKAGGVPYASLSGAAQDKVRSAVMFFAQKPTYHYPNVPDLGLYNAQKKAAAGLPPTATDFDVLRKAYAPWNGQRSWLGGLIHNIPENLAQNAASPLGALDVLTHPTTLGPEFAREQYQFGKSLIPGVGDPLQTIHDEPVSVGTLGLGLLRGAGGAGGTLARTGRFGEAAKMFATPAEREVVPAGFHAEDAQGKSIVEPINRGLTSPKLDVRLAQAASDKLASSVDFFGNRLDKQRVGNVTKESNRFEHQLARNEVEPAVRAATKLNANERRAAISFRGQSYLSLDEAAAHTRGLADAHAATEQAETAAGRGVAWKQRQQDLEQKAQIAEGLAQGGKRLRGGHVDENSEDFQNAIRANQAAPRAGEQHMIDQGMGNASTFERRAYIPRARIEAELHGNPDAAKIIDLAHQSNALTDELARAKQASPRAAALRKQIDQLQRVADDQASAARPERGTSERLRSQQLNLLTGAEESVAPDAFGADNPAPSTRAVERSDMRLGVENRTRARAARPLTGRIERAQARLDKIATPEQVSERIAQTHAEQAPLVDALRAHYREQVGAPPVEPGAPLDEHDPLWFQHAVESEKTFMGIRRGNRLTGTNLDAGPSYNTRLGTKGKQSTGELFSAEASTDPSIHFKNLGKPQRITAKLRNLQNHIAQAIHKPPAGSLYDARKYVLVDGGDGAQTALVPHTTEDAMSALHGLGDESVRSAIMQRFHEPDHVRGSHMATVPEGGDWYLMTKNARREVEGQVRSFDSPTLRALQKTTGFWRWATLTARPAWLTNNLGGNVVQTAMEGVGPKSMVRAFRTGTGGKYEGVVPPQVNGGGFMGGTMERPEGIRSGLMAPVDRISQGIVNANTKLENWARRAVAVQESLNIAKAQLHGEPRTIANNLHKTTQEVIDLARQRTPEADAQIMNRVHHALGDFMGKGNQNPALGVMSPFHRWFSFITKLTLEMPVRTPGRALVMQRLGQFGINEQNQENGGYTPDSWLGQVHIPNWVPEFGGQYKSTQALWPYSTLYQLASPTDQATTDPGQIGYTGMFGALNPAVNVGTEFATGLNPTFNFSALKDASGNPTGMFNPSVGAHALESEFPITNLISGYGAGDTSLNPTSPQENPRGAYSQPSQDFADRLAGYIIGTVAPRNAELERLAAWKRFLPAEEGYARKRALAGHGPKAKK